jgi:hypothetical protein
MLCALPCRDPASATSEGDFDFDCRIRTPSFPTVSLLVARSWWPAASSSIHLEICLRCAIGEYRCPDHRQELFRVAIGWLPQQDDGGGRSLFLHPFADRALFVSAQRMAHQYDLKVYLRCQLKRFLGSPRRAGIVAAIVQSLRALFPQKRPHTLRTTKAGDCLVRSSISKPPFCSTEPRMLRETSGTRST